MTLVNVFVRGVFAGALLFAVGCGSSPAHVDTGFGAGRAVPATMNCADWCDRMVECGVALCNEDTMSTRYTTFAELQRSQCRVVCDDALIQSTYTSVQWMCLFSSSCRQAADADYDNCHVKSHYTCS